MADVTVSKEEYDRLVEIERSAQVMLATHTTAAPVPLEGSAGPSPAEYLSARARLIQLLKTSTGPPPTPIPGVQWHAPYQWSPATGVPPTGSQMRGNAAPEAATAVYLRYTPIGQSSQRATLMQILPTTPMTIVDTGDVTRWAEYTVLSPPLDRPAQGYVEIPVRWSRGGAAALRQHDVELTVYVIP